MMQKRIGLITTMADHPWGGSEELWLALANEALKNGHDVFCSVYNWGELPDKLKEAQGNGLVVHKRSRISYGQIVGKIKGKVIQKSLAKNQLHSFVKRTNPDVLLISMGAFCDVEVDPFREFLKETKTSFSLIVHVNTERYVINPTKIKEFREVVKKADCVYFVSKRLREQAERQLAYRFENSEIVVNPVNMEEIGVMPYIDSGTVNFACVGRLQVDVKGHALLLQILGNEKWKNRDWVLNIYGDGPDREFINELICFYGIKHKVELKGFVNNIRKDIWAQNHLLLMPSYFEGLPIALIEAMLSGRTAVVTDVGGNSDVLSDGISGFVSEGVSPSSFEKAMDRAWRKKEDWKNIGETAFSEAKNYFGNNPIPDFLGKLTNEN